MNTENTSLRLQEAAAKCLSSLDAWNKDLKNSDAREALLDAVHELRKVTSRLEIDIAMNDRKVTNAKPIPVPEHKSKTEKKAHKPLSEILPVAEIKESNRKRKIEIENTQNDEDDDDVMDMDDADDCNTDGVEQQESKPRRPRRKKRENSQDRGE